MTTKCAAMMSGIGIWVSSKYQGITESELEGPEGIFQLFKLNPTDTSRTQERLHTSPCSIRASLFPPTLRYSATM